jgi:sulfur relay (sulfurtransferase) DsrF/TusC family protein
MPRKVLSIVESAYRATIEEQDDTVLWINHAMRGGGADLAILLRANAVNYTVSGQDASGLSFGDRRQTQPPRISDDVAALLRKGISVYFVQEDAAERGIEREEMVAGLEPVPRSGLPALLDRFDQIWHW